MSCAVRTLLPAGDGQRGRSRGRTRDLCPARTFDSTEHGIAYRPRGPGRRSGRSSPRTGKPGEGPQVSDDRSVEVAGLARAENIRAIYSDLSEEWHWKAGRHRKSHIRFGESCALQAR